MGSVLEVVVPSLVALVSGLAGGYLTGRQGSSIELAKWKRGRLDDHARESSLAVAELTRNLGAATHSMGWLTWKAQHRSSLLSAEDVQVYDTEMHQLFPSISGALSLVAALSQPLFRKLDPIVHEVYALDEKISHAGTMVLLRDSEGSSDLGSLVVEVRVLSENLNRRVSEILQDEMTTFRD